MQIHCYKKKLRYDIFTFTSLTWQKKEEDIGEEYVIWQVAWLTKFFTQKRKFSVKDFFRICLVNATKSAGNCGFSQIY